MKYDIQVNERLTKIKEKWSSIKFDVVVLSFIFFIPMSQTISVINISGMCYFYTHQTSGACAGVCAYNLTHQVGENVVSLPQSPKFSGQILLPYLIFKKIDQQIYIFRLNYFYPLKSIFIPNH